VPDAKKDVPKRSKPTGLDATRTEDESASEELAAETSILSLDDAVSSPKHKRLNVVEEYEKSNMKKSLSFVVVGKCATVLGIVLMCMQAMWIMGRVL
jgi:hypothetical protein